MTAQVAPKTTPSAPELDAPTLDQVASRDRVDRYGRVYVWEIPVRLTHWLNVLAITVLSFTGYYMGNPYVAVSNREIYGDLFMNNMRFLHITFGYLFVASVLIRTYWAVAGNRWASWMTLAPFFSPKGRRRFMHMLQYYTFLRRDPPVSMGHNSLAGFAYAIVVFLYFVQIISGFALHAQSDRTGLWWTLTGWIFIFFSNQTVRFVHHIVMYIILGFVIQHIYSSFLVDSEEATGTMSSIFSGWKFIIPSHPDHTKKTKLLLFLEGLIPRKIRELWSGQVEEKSA